MRTQMLRRRKVVRYQPGMIYDQKPDCRVVQLFRDATEPLGKELVAIAARLDDHDSQAHADVREKLADTIRVVAATATVADLQTLADTLNADAARVRPVESDVDHHLRPSLWIDAMNSTLRVVLS